MLVVVSGTLLLLLLGGAALIVRTLVLTAVLSLFVWGAYRLELHEVGLPWLFGRFFSHKTGVRVHVQRVTLRLLSSRGTTLTHAAMTVAGITIDNPPGYSSERALSTVGSVELSFDPWSLLAPSVLVQSILIQDVDVHMERRNGINNTRALRELIETRRRAHREGIPLPTLGPPPASAVTNAARTQTAARENCILRDDTASLTAGIARGADGGGIGSTSSDSDDSHSSHDRADGAAADGVERDKNLSGWWASTAPRSRLVAGRAAAAAKKAKAAAAIAFTRGKNTNAGKRMIQGGQALKEALVIRMGSRGGVIGAEPGCHDKTLCGGVEVDEDHKMHAARPRQEMEDGEGDVDSECGSATHVESNDVVCRHEELEQELSASGAHFQDESEFKMLQEMWNSAGHVGEFNEIDQRQNGSHTVGGSLKDRVMGGGLKAYKSVVGGRLGAVKSSVKTFMASQMGETMDGLRRRSRAHGEVASEPSAEQGGKRGVGEHVKRKDRRQEDLVQLPSQALKAPVAAGATGGCPGATEEAAKRPSTVMMAQMKSLTSKAENATSRAKCMLFNSIGLHGGKGEGFGEVEGKGKGCKSEVGRRDEGVKTPELSVQEVQKPSHKEERAQGRKMGECDQEAEQVLPRKQKVAWRAASLDGQKRLLGRDGLDLTPGNDVCRDGFRWMSWIGRLLTICIHPIVHVLDRKLVVVEVMTMQRLAVHVAKVLRVLQGDGVSPEPHLSAVATHGVWNHDAGSESEGRIGLEQRRVSEDEITEEDHGEEHRERSNQVPQGQRKVIAITEGSTDPAHMVPHDPDDETAHSDCAVTEEVRPLLVGTIRMNLDDFNPKGSNGRVGGGIAPSEVTKRIIARCWVEIRKVNRTRILKLGGGVAMKWLRGKVVKYRRKTRQRTHDSVNSASAAASVDERVGPEMDEREAHPGDDIERETERTMLEGRF